MFELNWNEITDKILIGSCPTTSQDIETIVKCTGITAILSLQTNKDLEELSINFNTLLNKAKELGVHIVRSPMKDFDKNDQKNRLLDAVKSLRELINNNHRVYVHCTAGINRSSLTVLSYLCFVQKMSFIEAYKLLKSKRPIVDPYIDVFDEVKKYIK